MTLFDVSVEKPRRAKKQPEPGTTRPTWSSYKLPSGRAGRHKCGECVQLSFEALPGPTPYIGMAYFSRRQDGVTAYYCHAHSTLQRAEDDKTFAGQATEQKGSKRWIA